MARPLDGGHGSDHAATYSLLSTSPPPYVPRRLFSTCDWSSFANTVFSPGNPGPASSVANCLSFATFIQQRTDKAIDDSTPWSRPCKKNAPWWNPDLRRLRRRLTWCECITWTTAVLVGAATTFYAVQKESKLAIRQARFLYWDHTTSQTDRDSAWKQLFKFTKLAAKLALPDFVGDGSFDSKCRSLRAEFFPETVDNLPPIQEACIKHILVDLRECFYPVTPDDVQSATASTTSTSAPGLDGISYLLHWAVHTANPLLLLTLFTPLLKFSGTPPAWKTAKIVTVPTPGKTDYSLPKAYQPIYLQPCLAKTMEKVIADCLLNAASLTGAISPEHFGCLRQRSADDAFQTLITPAQA